MDQPAYTPTWSGGLVVDAPLVFVSHKSEDEADVRRIIEFLERHGVRCWVSYRDIPYGGHFPQEITQALHKCDSLLVYVSATLLREPKQIERELTIADNRQLRIVPVFADEFTNLGSLEFYLSVPQRFYLTKGRENALDGLAAYLRGVPAPRGPTVPKPPTGRRWLIAGAAALGLCVAGLLAWQALKHRTVTPNAPPAPVVQKAPEPPAPEPPKKPEVPTKQQYMAALEALDFTSARKMLQQMIDTGDGDAAVDMGLMYLAGIGVSSDEKEAEKWFIKAAGLGSEAGRHNLQVLHDRWKEQQQQTSAPPKRDPADILRRADRGDPDAQYQAAELYAAGEGVEANPAKVFFWLRRSADNGNAMAMNEMGICYLNGTGVEADLRMARQYFAKAAAAGSEMAKHNIEFLDQQLGPAPSPATAPTK